ncbi:UNVERIFIED_CONTAM: hypothetical protein HDU68_009358 [Siphonaria sp. JEL0065]|nr:hypothetical protein HDU68_009358 [Siphonaria sp. JEL0065]
MLVTESVVDVQTSQGPMRLHVFVPTVTVTTHKHVKLSGVAVFTEIYQVTGPVERFCRQIAGKELRNGFIVACPESYHEFEPLGTVLKYDEEGTDRGNRYKIEKELKAYDEDATLTLDFLANHANCNGRLGATGMCLGGHLAFRCAFDKRVLAAVCYFATDIHSSTLGKGKKDDSLVRSKEIKGETVMIFGKFDNHVPVAGRQLIYKTLLEHGTDFGWIELPAQHAFIRDELSKGRYDPPLTKICFEVLLEVFQRRLVLGLGGTGGFITAFGLISLIIKDKLYMSEAMVAILFGIVIGPVAFRLFVPEHVFGQDLHQITLEFTRIIVAIQCMACGVDLPGNYLLKEWKSVGMLLGPIMIIKWFVSALGIYWIMGVTFLDALVISACITPTDPVLANSIVKGKFAEKHVPLNVRLILSAESGANDGLGTPFLLLAIYLQRLPVGQAIGEWTWKVVLYQVVLSVVIGAVTAYGAKRILKTAERREWIDKESILSFSIALALFVMGIVSLIGSDDILAVFVAGNVLTWDLWFNRKIASSHFQEVIDALLNLTYFIYIGCIVPWSSFSSGQDNLELWRLFLVALWVLALRRLPVVMALYPFIPTLKDAREAFFTGWFGPIGAGAIFYAHLAVVYFEYPASPLLPIIFFIVLASVLVHGGSVAFFNLSLNRTTTYAQWDFHRHKAAANQQTPVVVEDGPIVIGDIVMNNPSKQIDATTTENTVTEGSDAPATVKKDVSFLIAESSSLGDTLGGEDVKEDQK